jgi:Ca2+-binding EF-hand superfamily protein
MEEYIDFERVRSSLKIDQILFSVYLKEIYKDLSDRDTENKKNGITKITFYDYVKIQIFIAEKLFQTMDKDNDGFLNFKDFSEGMRCLFIANFEETSHFIYDLYDFDKDGKISSGDVKMVLSHLPLKTSIHSEYSHQLESFNEIEDILLNTFGEKTFLTYSEFVKVIESKNSDIFFELLFFIYENKPFTDLNINVYKDSPKKLKIEASNIIVSPINKSKNLPSPRKRSFLSPADNFMKRFSLNEEDLKYSSVTLPPEISGKNGMIRMENTLVTKEKKSNCSLNKIIRESKAVFDSPSMFLKKKESSKGITDFSLEENLIKMNNVSIDSNGEYDNDDIITFESIVYKLTDKSNMKSYYLALKGKEIYYYKNSKEEELLGMHNLAGCFILENDEIVMDNMIYYSFSIIFTSKIRNYYSPDKNIVNDWIIMLKKAVGYQSFFDFYEMLDEEIGEGKFGVVKLGLHKKTKEKVAIKIIKKESMNTVDIELVRSEIDIMKLCKHPNVVRLLDHFENAEYIFIVMEYLAGGDFGNYLQNKLKFKITEERLSKDIYQIASGLKYLHQYGILHRDLKPENIMLSDKSEKYKVKIMDFGLSKILGPEEKVADGFGTLSFVAPEVLIRQPYDKQIDIWSLGVILYYALTGTLPFDDENDNEEVIAKMTVFVEVEFPSDKWKNKSQSVINLIKKALIKDPEKRINIDEFLDDEWIKKYN